jgi:hypothetical protein
VSLAVLMADVPVDLGRDEAREAARRELSDPAYGAAEPGLLEQAMDVVLEWLDELFAAVATASPGGALGLLVLLALLVVAVVVVRLRVGPTARTARVARPVFDARPRSAAEHRAAAAAAAAAGAFDDAVREQFRAIARGLEERGVLDERPGRTADEVAADAGVPELPAAARVFDDVVYGGRAADLASYRFLVHADGLTNAAGR